MKIICILGSIGTGVDSIYGAIERWNTINFTLVKNVDEISDHIKKNDDSKTIFLVKPDCLSDYLMIYHEYKDFIVPILLTATERTRIHRLLNSIPDDELSLAEFADILTEDETVFDEVYIRDQIDEDFNLYVPKENYFDNDKSLIHALSAVKRFILQQTRDERE